MFQIIWIVWQANKFLGRITVPEFIGSIIYGFASIGQF